MTPETDRLITERIRYPSGGLIKWLYKTPILLYRLGLGGVIGRLFMIMTTTGRTSGLPRRTAIEYHQYNGRKYVMVGWEHSDWYRNLLADPRLTIQTADGVEHVRARRLVTDAEYHEAWDFAERSPFMRAVMKLTGAKLTREQFISQKDRFILLTFDPTEEPTPPPLPADLSWALSAFTALLAIGVLVAGRRRQ
ncbi:MAG: nitroreductase family deazaflavin-dependent oxidoreductase [Candidatus Flexifilum sp.]|jgi:deazaflavin-dependent oxidoreductase (nitroreductase family)